MGVIPEGWYSDPDRSWRLRYYGSDGWSAWVAVDDERTLAPLTHPDSPPPSGLDVTRMVLSRAHSHGVITTAAYAALSEYLEVWERTMPEAVSAPPRRETMSRQAASPEAGVGTTGHEVHPVRDAEGWAGFAPPSQPEHPAVAVSPRQPGPMARWWSNTVETVKSDLAVHGLAYLGVLLLFAGVFGLVVWSFGDISRNLRPVAELAIPASLFLGAAMLRRRGTTVVAGALEVAAGLLLPIVVVAAFVDGAPIPPDPTGSALPVTLSIASLSVSAGYAIWTRLHPSSALAYLVAPVFWLALGLLSLAFADVVPQGEQVAQPQSTEVAVMALAAGTTLLLVRRWPGGRLGDATLAAGPLSVGVLVVLALLAGAVDGWPSTPAVLTAIGLVLGLEALAVRLPGTTVTVATSVVVGLGLIAAQAALASDPATSIVGFGAATAWAAYHRATTTGTTRLSYTVPAAVLPAGVAAAVVSTLGWPWGLMLTNLVLLGVVLLGRATHRLDTFWVAWGAAAAALVAAATPLAMVSGQIWPGDADTTTLESAWQTPVVAVVAAAVLVVASVRPAGWKAWGVVAATAEAWALFVAVRGDELDWTTIGWAVGAAVLVLALETGHRVLDGRVQRAHLAHGVLAALALGVLALVSAATLSQSSSTLAIVSGLGALGWAAVAIRDDRDGSPAIAVVIALLPELAGIARHTPALAAAALATAAIHLGVDAVTTVDDVWWPVVTASCALGAVALARLASRWLPRTVRMLHEVWLLLAVVAAVAVVVRLADAGGIGPSALALSLVVIGAMVSPPSVRDARDAWVGWAVTAPLAVLTVEQLGAERESWPQVLIAWGGVLVVGVLTARRWHVLSPVGRLVRRSLPPLTVGATALTVGVMALPFRADEVTVGWWYGIAGVVVLVATALSQIGQVAGIAPVLLTVSYATLAPWEPLNRPWTTVVWAAGWLLAAELLRDIARHRWMSVAATSTSVAGQVVLAVNLWYVVLNPDAPVGLVLTGAVSTALATRARHRVTRWSYAVVGVLLVLWGAAAEGPGWLAIALASLSVAASLTAWLVTSLTSTERQAVRLIGAAAGTGAWWSLMVWSQWTTEVQVIVTTMVAGAVLLGLAVLGRVVAPSHGWVLSWGLLVLVSLIAASAVVPAEGVPRAPAGQWVAGGYLLAAAAVGLSARPLGLGLLRPTATVLLALGIASYLYGIDAGSGAVVAVGCTLALASLVLSIGLTVGNRAEVWQSALLLATAGAELAALIAALLELPQRSLLVVALLVLAVQFLGLGRVRSLTPLMLLGPPVLAVAWTLYASETVGGNPQWYAAPIGLSLVAVAGLLRWDRRQSGLSVATVDVVSLELLGLAITTVPALVQMATDSLGYVLVALGEGAVITLWGAVSKVRRRLAFGAGVVVAATVLLVVIPLFPLLPEWRGATLWIGVAVLGLAAITVATLIERGRAKVSTWMATLAETLHDWE